MKPTFAPGRFEPALVGFMAISSNLFARNNMESWRPKVVQTDKDEEQIVGQFTLNLSLDLLFNTQDRDER